MINDFEAFYSSNRPNIEMYNYVRRARSSDHFLSFYKNKIGELVTNFGEEFNLIISGSPDIKDDYYIIPFKKVSYLFKTETLSRDKEDKRIRWVGGIKDNVLNIRNAGDFIISEYRGNVNMLEGVENLVPLHNFIQDEIAVEKKAEKLPNKELIKRIIKQNNKTQAVRHVASLQYGRNPYIVVLVKRYANGVCQLCNNPAPFKNTNGEPYLEVHHIEWLSKGGKDILENTVALCPNCHKRMHVLNDEKDIIILKEKIGLTKSK